MKLTENFRFFFQREETLDKQSTNLPMINEPKKEQRIQSKLCIVDLYYEDKLMSFPPQNQQLQLQLQLQQ